MEALKFYDVKKKKSFTTDKYKVVNKKNSKTKKMMKFAVAKAPSGIEAWRVLGSA